HLYPPVRKSPSSLCHVRIARVFVASQFLVSIARQSRLVARQPAIGRKKSLQLRTVKRQRRQPKAKGRALPPGPAWIGWRRKRSRDRSDRASRGRREF